MNNGIAVDKNNSHEINAAMENIAWPTVLLTIAHLAGFAVVSLSAVWGIIPIWVGFILNELIMSTCFSMLHEAAHGNICGKRRSAFWLNDILGYLCGFLLLLDYRGFRRLHMLHHRSPNNPALDPDCWAKAESGPAAALKCLFTIPAHAFILFRHCVLDPRTKLEDHLPEMASHLAVWLFATTVIALSYSFGLLTEVLLLWIIPAVVSACGVEFTHTRRLHTSGQPGSPIANTKIVRAHGLRGILLDVNYRFLNYHLIHHLFPRVPFYRHAKLFHMLRPMLEQKGAHIVDLGTFSGLAKRLLNNVWPGKHAVGTPGASRMPPNDRRNPGSNA